MYLIYVVIIVLTFFLFRTRKETFIAYNNTNVPEFDVDSAYFKQTKSLNELLNAANKRNKDFDENTDLKDYTLYNKNIDFPLAKIFKSIITENLISNKVFSDKVYVSSDILNLYTKDI
jgi:hypothetical protein